MKSFVGLLLLFAVVAAINVPNRCLEKKVCSPHPQTIWTTDGTSCFPMRNSCHFENEKCERIIRGDKPLRTTTKKNCQKMCSIACGDFYSPICGEFDGPVKLFSNMCSMINYACNSGETYLPCESALCANRMIDV